MADRTIDLILGLAEGEGLGVHRERRQLTASEEGQRLRGEVGEEVALRIFTRRKRRVEGFSTAVIRRKNLQGLEARAAGNCTRDGRTGVTAIREELILPLRLVLRLVVHVVEDIDGRVLGLLALNAEEADDGHNDDCEESEVTVHGTN